MSDKMKGWENIPLHDYCSLFPEMNEEQYETLVMSVKSHGLIDSIIIYEVDEGDEDPVSYILDGQNRRMACLDASVEPHFSYYEGDDPLGYVISKNVGRRHLTTGQLAALAAGVANMRTGDNQFTHEGEVISLDKAAALFGTSAKSVQRFRAIQESDPKAAMEVAKGNETLNIAYNTSRPPSEVPNTPYLTTGSTSEEPRSALAPVTREPVEEERGYIDGVEGGADAAPAAASSGDKNIMENGGIHLFKLNKAQFERLADGKYVDIKSDHGNKIRLIREK